MKHETRMARLGVRSTSSTHHIHLDDYTHRIMSTLERESFLTISSLPTTYSIVLYCSRYSVRMMRQSSKFTKTCPKLYHFIRDRGLPIYKYKIMVCSIKIKNNDIIIFFKNESLHESSFVYI